MKTFLLIFLWLTSVHYAVAQSIQSAGANKMPAYFGELSSNIGNSFGQYRTVGTDELELKKPTVIGNTFLSDDWRKGTLYISQNTQLETPSFKYDIENNQFLFKQEEAATQADASDNVRFMHGTHVLFFEMVDPLKGSRRFLNSVNAGMHSEGKPVLGFLEILAEGDLILYQKIETKFLKSNYNVALHAGDKNDRIIKKDIYFIGHKNSIELHEIGKNKHKNLSFFTGDQQKIREYVEKHNLKFSQQADLVQLVSFYNSLPK